MLKVVDGAVNISIKGQYEILAQIQDKFKWRPNRFFMNPRYVIWKQTVAKEKELGVKLVNKGWDGWKKPGKLLDSGLLVMGRGWFTPIQEVCELEGWELDTSQMIVNPYKDLQPDDIPYGVISDRPGLARHLDQWELQKTVIAALLRAGCGRVKVTVSGGKTAILCSVASLVKSYRPAGKILYVTPNERLVSQSTVESRHFLPKWDIGQYGGEFREKDARDMVVATMSILNTNLKKLVDAKWFNQFVCIMCDECQFSASPSQQKILTACKAWFRVGVSDTTKAFDPEKHALLTGTFGPILNETIEAGELIEMGQIAKPLITVVKMNSCFGEYDHLSSVPEIDTPGWALSDGEWIKGRYAGQAFQLDQNGDYKLDDDGKEIPIPGQCYFSDEQGDTRLMETKWCLLERKYDQAIIRCKARNAYIRDKCHQWQVEDRRTLVIVTRTVQVKILEAELLKVCNSDLLKVLYGVHKLEERDDAFDWLRKTPGAILISPLVKIGTSINEIDRGIVADYVADKELANQFVGRFIRKKFKGDNRSEIVWFHETQHRAYAAGSMQVINWLKGIKGYEFDEDEA